MRIGIYKPFKKVFFLDDDSDLSAVSYEVVNTFKILQGLGHEVFMLSPTDDPSVRGDPDERYDRIILFSGSFELDPLGYDVVRKLRYMTDRLDFMFTDMRLTPRNEDWQQFDHVYTQSSSHEFVNKGCKRFNHAHQYAHIAQLIAYGFPGFSNTVVEAIRGKDIEFYFGGTERGRLAAFLEFVHRPGHVVTTKSSSLAIDNRVGRRAYLELMGRSKFSVVIADEDYNVCRFTTPRFYEHILRDVVPFVHTEFDPDGAICPVDHFLRVENYIEMRGKMSAVLADVGLHRELLEEQRARITPEMAAGKNFAAVVGV